MKVANYLVNGEWILSDFFAYKDNALVEKIHQIALPLDETLDKLIWTDSVDGDLSNKLAFSFLPGHGPTVHWAKMLWNAYTPPTGAFITWRFLHNKLPTDDNLRKRGCYIVSICCCFCRKQAETSSHIFLQCPVTLQLWDWLLKATDQHLDFSSILNISRMVQHVMNSAIVHIMWSIWLECNNKYFDGVQKPMSTLFNTILAEVLRLSFMLDIVKGASSMQDFKLARLFSIPFKTNRVNPCREIIWVPPHGGCMKINCDGSVVGSPSCGSIGVIFRASQTMFCGAFAQNIGYATALEAEYSACMFAIEKAKELHLTNIWIETDSVNVIRAFHFNTGVPWKMHIRWHNCLLFCRSIRSLCTHVNREGNLVADALAKNGQGLALYSSHPLAFISSFYVRDCLGLPFSRLSFV
uniref:Ribonuclease H n=1 Tax=Medicago truncatula TaxID=3880 RepID=Q2HUA4_MEDTR|nr:Ribonuclease H [Medicago truncatula]